MTNDIEMIEMNEEDPQQLFNQLDHRGFNLLLIAAENGRSDEVQRLLSLGFDVNSSFGPHTAASLAYHHSHYDTLLILLNENSKFPSDFNAEASQHAELIAFNNLMNEFQEHLFGEDVTELQNIINEHRHLRYFYNVSGHSAAFEALNNLIISCYELFVQNNVLLALDEDFNEAIVSLTDDQKEQVRRIHERHSIPLPNNHLMIIHGSLFVGHDETETDRLNIAQNAINFLNEIPQIQPILKLVARAGGFKIIFDFNRENTQFMNPKSGRDTRGLFCTTRHIYVAARNLLNEVNQMEVYGTIAHELTHFAMDLVYNNNCKPYKQADRETIGREFHQILHQSRQQKVVEDIISAVWRYEEKNQLAELIVRVPHMMAFYANNRGILNERSQQFQSLFNFYQTRVLPDIENKIPTINAEVNQMRADFYDKTIQKVSKWRKTAKCLSILAPIGIIIAALLTFTIVFMPNISYNELSSDDQVKVINGNVKFLNITVKFHELYNQTNTHLLDSLNSIQLRTLINGDTLDLSEQLNSHLQNEIFLIYSNMTESLRQKLTDGRVNLQGESTTVKQLIGDDDNSEIYHALSASQVRELFIGTLKLGKIQEIKTEFYIERDFTYHGRDFNPPKLNFDQISSIADDKKMFLLSGFAGAGKTTTFKHLSLKLKEKFPHYWIFYIDLKRYLKVYEKFERNFHYLKVLKEILSITDELEAKIFAQLFNSHRVILLYDGVDEISPKFKEFFIKLIASVRNLTTNQQWIATRPQHTHELMDEFNQIEYFFTPYNDDNKIKFIENVLKARNAENLDAKEILKAIESTLSKIDFNSPLMLHMTTELYIKNVKILEDYNMYALYDEIISMKNEIVGDKGKIVNRDRENRKSELTIWQVYQIYALQLLFRDGFEDHLADRLNDDSDYDDDDDGKIMIDINGFQLLKRWKNQKSKWTPEAISRHGILIVDHWNTENEYPDFVHRTFAEFFAVQFILEDLYELDEDDDINDTEIYYKLNLLIDITYNEFDQMFGFILSFIITHESKQMHEYFYKLITCDKMRNFLTSQRKDLNYLNLIEILNIDERFLKEFKFSDNKTIFQQVILNVNHLSLIDAIITIYETSLGAKWINYISYSLKENISLPSDDEIDRLMVQDFTVKYPDKRDNEVFEKFYMKMIFKILSFIAQDEISQNDILQFFKNYIALIFEYSFRSSLLTEKLLKAIEIYFIDCKEEFLEIISYEIRTIDEKIKADEYQKNSYEFFHKLEEFLRLDETVDVDDVRLSIMKLVNHFCGINCNKLI